MSKTKLKWSASADDADLDAALKYLSLLTSDSNASALVRKLRGASLVEHAAKDLLRAAQLPLLPREEPHVDKDLARIEKGKPLPPVLIVRGEIDEGLPLVVADGYHRICAVIYFDENAPVSCRMVGLQGAAWLPEVSRAFAELPARALDELLKEHKKTELGQAA